MTALHIAASSGHLALVKQLIERGADPNQRDPLYDGTPQGWANHNGQIAIRDYLGGVEAT